MLMNLSAKHTAEAAIAAAQMLPYLPAAAELLSQPDAVPALVSAFLEEHSQPCIDTLAGKILQNKQGFLLCPAYAVYNSSDPMLRFLQEGL